MFSPRLQTPSGPSETGVPAAHSPVPLFRTPETVHHPPDQSLGPPGQPPIPKVSQPNLLGQSPVRTDRPGQSPIPSPQQQLLLQLPDQSPAPSLEVRARKGLRRRLKLKKVHGARKQPDNASVAETQIRVSIRARHSLLVTRVKLRRKGGTAAPMATRPSAPLLLTEPTRRKRPSRHLRPRLTRKQPVKHPTPRQRRHQRPRKSQPRRKLRPRMSLLPSSNPGQNHQHSP